MIDNTMRTAGVQTLAILSVVLLLAITGSEAAAQSCVAPPSGIVGWWPGDGNANDIVGSNNGTIHSSGSNTVTFTPGMVGQGFQLAPGAYVDVGNAPVLHLSTGDFTAELWFNFTQLGYRSQAPLVIKMAVAPNIDGWNFAADGPIFRTGGGDHNTGTGVSLNANPQPGVWYHAAAVKQGGTITLYLNGGQVVASTPIDVFYDTNSADLIFGFDTTQGDFFVGQLDEVSVYNRALSLSEIAAIYNAGSAGKCKFSTVSIEIKPPTPPPASINLSSAGVVPVAILSTPTFDATQVDPATVSLAGAEVQLIGKSGKYQCGTQDVNGDGLNDLLCQVSTAQFLIQPGDSNAVLQAKTFSGQPIQGQEAISIVPQ